MKLKNHCVPYQQTLSDRYYSGKCHEKPLLWYYRSLLVLTLGHHEDVGGVRSLLTT